MSRIRKGILKNQFGFSMAETMMAAGLAGTVALAVVGIMRSANYIEKATQNKEAVVANLARLGYELQLNLQQAMDVDSLAIPLNASTATIQNGFIRRAYNSDAIGVVPDGTSLADPIALFIGDFGGSINNGALNTKISRFRGIGIYYLHSEPSNSGAVIISTRPPTGADQDIEPDSIGSMFDGLVGFSIDNMRIVNGAANGPPTSVQFHAIGRYFSSKDRATLAKWCHPNRMGGGSCPNQIPYHDIDRVYNVVLRNNALPAKDNGIGAQRGGLPIAGNMSTLFGTLHYFIGVPHRGGN
ncbi:MAG: hypothetical protein KDD61_00375 [Bdellovibrionales bacterium]|nr:hypothetical protein [Bdellovibrionales bacterium]